MDLIIINDSKLKVTLTSNDLSEFSLDADTLDYSNAETKKMFWDILAKAKRSAGFCTDGHRVLVQLYPSRAGGCEMFITKLGLLPNECYSANGDRSNCECSDIPEARVLHYKPSHKKMSCEGRTGVFGFDDLSSLLSVCKILRNIGYDGNSSAYRCDKKRYHLFLDGLDTFGFMPPDEFTFINEYGDLENTEAMSYYIEEHAKPICESKAVEILGTL